MVRKNGGRKNAKQDGASVAVPRTDKSKPCLFCNSAIDDEVRYGNIYTIGSVTCHYFCVLLSCCMVQSGSDEEGLFGFLEPDMLAELQRGKKLKCCYCKQNGATLACCSSICRKQFHLNCGRKNGVTSLFFGNFQSFCHKHTAVQELQPDLQRKVEVRMGCWQRKQNAESRDANSKASGEKQGGANVDVSEVAQNGSNTQADCKKGVPVASEDIAALVADISTASLSCEGQKQNGRTNSDLTDVAVTRSTEKRRLDARKFDKVETPERRLPIRSCKNSTATTQAKAKDTIGKKASPIPDTKTDIANHGTDCECTSHTCPMCYETVQAFPDVESLWPPCCAADVWLHRYCVQRMALNAGKHYLKCPLCNDRETFCSMVEMQGIYIPDRDAAWELETDAFAELQQRHARCDAIKCQCPRGRCYNTQKGPWQLMLCSCCGSQGCHSQCMLSQSQLFICTDCCVVSADDINAVEQASSSTSSDSAVDRPVMPSRMSLARTKHKSRRSWRKSLSESDDFPNGVVLNISPSKMQIDSQESESDVEIEIIESDLEMDAKMQVAKEKSCLAMELTGSHSPEVERLLKRVKPGPKSAKIRLLEKLMQEQELAKTETKDIDENQLLDSSSMDSESSEIIVHSILKALDDTVPEEKNEQNVSQSLSPDLTQNCTLSISAQNDKSDDIHTAVPERVQDGNFEGYISKEDNLTQLKQQSCGKEIEAISKVETPRKSVTEWPMDTEGIHHSSPKTVSDNKLSKVETVSDVAKDKSVPMDSKNFEYYYLSEVDPSSRNRREKALEIERDNSKICRDMKISEDGSKIENNSQESSSESELEIYVNMPDYDSKSESPESKTRVSNEEICIDINATECIMQNLNTNSLNHSDEIEAESHGIEIARNTKETKSEESYTPVEKDPSFSTDLNIVNPDKESFNTELDMVKSEKEAENIKDCSSKNNSENNIHVDKGAEESSKSLRNSEESIENTQNEINSQNNQENFETTNLTKNNNEVIVEEVEANHSKKDENTKAEDDAYLQDISSDSEIEVIIKKQSISPEVKTHSNSDCEIFIRKETETIESDEDIIFHTRAKLGTEEQNISNSSTATVDSEDRMIDEIISKELAKRSRNFLLQSKFRQRNNEKTQRTRTYGKFNSDTEDEGRTRYPRSCNSKWGMKISSSKDKIHLKIKNRNENMDFVYEKESSQEDNYNLRIDSQQRHLRGRNLLRNNVKSYRCENPRSRRRVHSLANERDTWSSSKSRVNSKGDGSFEHCAQVCHNQEKSKLYCHRDVDWSERPSKKPYEQYNSHWLKSRENSQEHNSDRSYRKGGHQNREQSLTRHSSQAWPKSEKKSAKYKNHINTENIDVCHSHVSTSRRLIENQAWVQKKTEKEALRSMTYRMYSKLLKTRCDTKPRENSSTRKRHNGSAMGAQVESKRIKSDLTPHDSDKKVSPSDGNFRRVYRQSILDISPESGRAEDMIIKTKEDIAITPISKRRRRVVIKQEDDGKKQTDIMRFFHRI